jgi:hypothetical protein
MNKTIQRALVNAERNGSDYEKLAWERLRQCDIGRVFEKTHDQCKIPMAESLQQSGSGLGPWQHADAFLPDTADGAGTYVEVKAGSGNETDSIDKKYLGDLVLFRHGWYGLTNQNSLFGKPSMVFYIFAGAKERSFYTQLFMNELDDARIRCEKWAPYVQAIRLSEMNTENIAALIGPITEERGRTQRQPVESEMLPV